MTTFDWDAHSGRIVTLDGLKCRVRVERYNAIYPYKHEVLKVWAEPISRNSRKYREIRAQLGDDFSTDVLESDVTVVCDVQAQLLEGSGHAVLCGRSGRGGCIS